MTFYICAAAAILLYTAFCLYIGLGKGYDKSGNQTARGYFIGSGTPFFVLFMTTVASFFSTWIFTGAPGMFYQHGVSWVASMTWQCISIFIMGILGPKFYRLSKEYNYITPAEMMGHYYKSNALRTSYGFFMIIYIVPLLLAQVSGCGLALYALFGGNIPSWVCTLYTTVFVGLYVYFGGFKSQAWIDSAQGFMFTLILWISVFILVFNQKIGSFSNMWEMAEALNDNCLYFITEARNLSGFWTWKMYLSFFVAQGIGCFFTPYVWQRMYAAKNGRIPRKMAGLLAPYYCFLFMTTALIFGVLGRVYGVDMANSDSIIVTMCAQYAPLWTIVVVIGILAAGMSTISSILVSSTSMISVDIVKQLRPDIDSRGLRNIGRISIVVVMLIAIVSGFITIPGVAMLTNISASGFLLCSVPVLGMYFWRRSTPAAAFWSFTISQLITCGMYILNINPFGFTPGFVCLWIELVLFVSISLITKPMDRTYQTNYFACLGRTRDRN